MSAWLNGLFRNTYIKISLFVCFEVGLMLNPGSDIMRREVHSGEGYCLIEF